MGQELIVYAVVGLAALNLGRIWFGSTRGKSGCGKCDGCGSKPRSRSKAESGAAPKPAAPQLVQLQMNLKSKE